MKKIASLLLVLVLALSVTACGGGGSTKEADLTKVMSDMKVKITNTDMMDLAKEDLTTNYDIAADDIKQFAAYVDTTGIKADEIVLVEAVDGEAAKRIKDCLDTRYQQKEVENKDYLPEQYAIIEKCNVTMDGNYVSMIVSPDAETLTEIYNSAIK